MHHLAIGQTRTGLLAEEDDSDYYRFFLANDDHIRLTITPPPDGSILPNLYWYNSPMKVTTTQAVGKPIVLEGVFSSRGLSFLAGVEEHQRGRVQGQP